MKSCKKRRQLTTRQFSLTDLKILSSLKEYQESKSNSKSEFDCTIFFRMLTAIFLNGFIVLCQFFSFITSGGVFLVQYRGVIPIPKCHFPDSSGQQRKSESSVALWHSHCHHSTWWQCRRGIVGSPVVTKKAGLVYQKFEQLLMYVLHAVEQLGSHIQSATWSHNPIFTFKARLHLDCSPTTLFLPLQK